MPLLDTALSEMVETTSQPYADVHLQSTCCEQESTVLFEYETQELPTHNACSSVLNDFALLSMILGYDGSLAYYHKNYNAIVGFESPLPVMHRAMLQYRRGTKSNILVCKKWKDMIIGKGGLHAWKIETKNHKDSIIAVANDAVRDMTLSWTARIIAMAVSDDVDNLKTAFANTNDTSCGVGAAMAEQISDEYCLYDYNPVPKNHPFYNCCQCHWNVVEDSDDFPEESFNVSIAYAAAYYGAFKVLKFMVARHGALWSEYFDQKGTTMLSNLVRESCYNPTDDGLVKSVAILLSNDSAKKACDPGALYFRHRGSSGNHLHLAAARGHTQLVQILLQGGMNPMRRCDKQRFGDERDKGVSQYYLPVDWAAIRCHGEVVGLLNVYLGTRGKDDLNTKRPLNQASQYSTSKKSKSDQHIHIQNLCGPFTTPDGFKLGRIKL